MTEGRVLWIVRPELLRSGCCPFDRGDPPLSGRGPGQRLRIFPARTSVRRAAASGPGPRPRETRFFPEAPSCSPGPVSGSTSTTREETRPPEDGMCDLGRSHRGSGGRTDRRSRKPSRLPERSPVFQSREGSEVRESSCLLYRTSRFKSPAHHQGGSKTDLKGLKNAYDFSQ